MARAAPIRSKSETAALASSLDFSRCSTMELRWDYGAMFAPSDAGFREAIATEVERRGETLDGPAERKGGASFDGARWRGRIQNGHLVTVEEV